MRKPLGLFGALCLVASATVALAEPIKVTVDTTALSGVGAALAFDLIDGGLPATSTVMISSFTTDGVLGGSASSGGVSGSFPGSVTLADTDFFNEYLQGITLGTSFSFVFETSGGPSDLPDGFSFFVLDALATTSLVTTSDPTGANAILLYSIGVTSPLALFEANEVLVTLERVNRVPEPGVLLLALTAFCVMLARPRRLAGALWAPRA